MQSTVRERFATGQANPGTSLARALDTGQPVRTDAAGPSDYAFLLKGGLSPAMLAIAEGDARRAGVAVHDVLLSAGLLSPAAYAAALAAWVRVPVAGWEASVEIEPPTDLADPDERPLRGRMNGQPCMFVCAETAGPKEIGARISALRSHGLTVALCSRVRLDAALESALQPVRLETAVKGLHRHDPALSASGLIWMRQVIAAVVIVGLIIGGAWVDFDVTLAAVSCLVAAPFLCATFLRIVAVREILDGPALLPKARSFEPEPLASPVFWRKRHKN